MAKDFNVNISEGFDLNAFADSITQMYKAKGFKVRTVRMNGSVQIVFDKDCGGINTLLGLGQGITATCSVMGNEGNILSVNFSDGDWTGKIVGLAVGWFLCFIPFITAIVGTIKQLSFEKELANDMQIMLGGMQ